jgi:hypothetical protein
MVVREARVGDWVVPLAPPVAQVERELAARVAAKADRARVLERRLRPAMRAGAAHPAARARATAMRAAAPVLPVPSHVSRAEPLERAPLAAQAAQAATGHRRMPVTWMLGMWATRPTREKRAIGATAATEANTELGRRQWAAAPEVCVAPPVAAARSDPQPRRADSQTTRLVPSGRSAQA